MTSRWSCTEPRAIVWAKSKNKCYCQVAEILQTIDTQNVSGLFLDRGLDIGGSSAVNMPSASSTLTLALDTHTCEKTTGINKDGRHVSTGGLTSEYRLEPAHSGRATQAWHVLTIYINSSLLIRHAHV